jgi:hypothetical protein
MGFKKTSELIAISFGVSESAANTFTQEEVSLQLDVLNNEIFVVLAVDLNPTAPDLVAAQTTETRALVSSTSNTAMVSLSNSNVIAEADLIIVSDAANSVPFTRAAEETYSGNLEYVALISTNNLFVAVKGTNNTAAKGSSGRIFGFRARADSATYAALVQSEVLSA